MRRDWSREDPDRPLSPTEMADCLDFYIDRWNEGARQAAELDRRRVDWAGRPWWYRLVFFWRAP